MRKALITTTPIVSRVFADTLGFSPRVRDLPGRGCPAH
jgi:hypothetical protein